MKVLEFLDKCVLFITITMHNDDLISLWYYYFIPVPGTGFKTFIGKYRLEYQVIPFSFLRVK